MTWNDVISSKKNGSAYNGFRKKIAFPYDNIFEKF